MQFQEPYNWNKIQDVSAQGAKKCHISRHRVSFRTGVHDFRRHFAPKTLRVEANSTALAARAVLWAQLFSKRPHMKDWCTGKGHFLQLHEGFEKMKMYEPVASYLLQSNL